MRLLTKVTAFLVLGLSLSLSQAQAQFGLPEVKIPLPPGVDGRPPSERIGDGRQGAVLIPRPKESLSTNFPLNSMREISVTFTNRAPYGVDFILNGGQSVSPIRAKLAPGYRNTYRMTIPSGVTPIVQIRQPTGTYQNFTLSHQGRYNLTRTPDNKVINQFE